MAGVSPPDHGDTWVGLTPDPLPLDRAAAWVVLPSCGAVVTFGGTARDHSSGRPEVTELEYEAYDEQVVPRLTTLAERARDRWPTLGRVAVLHRTGRIAIGEASVVVAVSAPHRAEAFEAARWLIDTLKETVPVWKRERWRDGDDWALDVHPLDDVEPVHDVQPLDEVTAP